jgi:hypothetical protein
MAIPSLVNCLLLLCITNLHPGLSHSRAKRKSASPEPRLSRPALMGVLLRRAALEAKAGLAPPFQARLDGTTNLRTWNHLAG